MSKKLICMLLAYLMIPSLSACGKQTEQPAELVVEGNAVPGYIPSEISVPKELGRVNSEWDAQGDTLFLSGYTGEALIGCYDTVNDDWTLLTYDSNAIPGSVALRGLSVSGNAVWALLESRTEQSMESQYWMYFCDRTQGSTGSVQVIPFSGGESTEASGLYFSGILALDENRAILCAGEQGYVVDREMNLQQKLDLQGTVFQSSLRSGTERLYHTGHMEGQNYVVGTCSFSPETLSFSPARELEFAGSFFSENGRWLNSVDGTVCEIDPESGAVKERLFRWIDVALSYASKGGYALFENSAGDFFYPVMDGKSVIKVTQGMIKERQTLVLGSFGGAQAGFLIDPETGISRDLLDAVIRFNNTNPDYKVEIRKLDFDAEGQRDKRLIELATGSGIDILDTAGLPELSLDSGLLLDMLPYLDADPDLSREDFIQPLLNAMLKNGGLYELTARVTLIGFAAHPDRFPGRDAWTVEEATEQMREMPDNWQLFPSWQDREVLLDMLAKMATAEFVDWENGSSSFDSPEFKAWLQLVKDAPYSAEYTEDPQLLYMSWDLAANTGATIRMALQDDYVYCGFPGTSGSGCYFIQLGTGPDQFRTTAGAATRLGIMASSQHPNGAWQLIRLLLTNAAESDIMNGIPVLQSSFEAALQASISDQIVQGFDNFNADDAQRLRELVYATDKLVRCDETLLDMIKTNARAYFGGQISLDEAADRIQSSARLYVAEQG